MINFGSQSVAGIPEIDSKDTIKLLDVLFDEKLSFLANID